MTLDQCVEGALRRAEYCKSRKKNTRIHRREAELTCGLILAKENQKNGKHYRNEVLNVLRKPTKGVRELARQQQGELGL